MHLLSLPRPLLLLPIALLTLAACDSGDPEEERVGISGRWVGELRYVAPDAPADTLVLPVDLTLRDEVSNVTGSGSIELPTETLEFVIPDGLYSGGSVRLTVIYDRPPPGSISGNVSAERDFIDGTLTGPGLANGRVELSLALRRVP